MSKLLALRCNAPVSNQEAIHIMPLAASRLRIALRAIAEASAIARHVQASTHQIRRMTKDDYSPVTVADYAVQAHIALRLQEEFGTVPLVGEESAKDLLANNSGVLRDAVVEAVQRAWPGLNSNDALRAIDLGEHDASGDAYWTLDPIDGTKGFLRGGQYAISLAYIERGTVLLGVLGCPNLGRDFSRAFDQPDPTGTLFYAARGAGAYALPASQPEANPEPIRIADGRSVSEMRICESVEAAHSRQDATREIADYLKTRGAPARLDSQCKYAVVARGQADAYLRFPTSADYVEKIWDHAAGSIVAEEAGAKVTDIDGLPLDFGRGSTLQANRGIACAAPHLHALLLAAKATLFG
ncbi:MAG: 3'(2'),5'-bisphosphate nucleotidase [Gammaproteobacteria bacterium]|nr:3'(2'),5'-bisphosphate nucleotidase [Gammaproteobacteria bacterium]